MKRFLILALMAATLLLSACKEIPDDVIVVPSPDQTTAPETTTEPETTAPETTEPETTEPHVHTPEPIAAVAPTCTATGLSEGEKCSVCGEILKEQTEVAKLPHTEAEIPAKAASCQETGLTAGKKCSVCNTVTLAQTEVAKADHTYVEGKCSLCGALRVSEGLEFQESKDGKGYEVCGMGECTDTVLIIPSTYEGKPVVKVAITAFMGKSELTAVYIPEGVIVIDDMAFRGCSNVKTVSLPKTLTTIGMGAFRGMTSLEKFIYEGKEADWTKIEKGDKWDDGIESYIVGPETGDAIVCDHKIVLVEAEAATCKKEGVSAGTKCSICGKILSGAQKIDKLQHEYGADNICIKCGDPKTPHTHTTEIMPAKAATCINVGYTEGEKCSVCDEILTPQKEIPVTEHTMVGSTCSTCSYNANGSEGLTYVLISGENAYAVSGRGSATDAIISIPAMHDNLPVTTIVGGSFAGEKIAGIIMPEGITTIGDEAFKGCSELKIVSIPSTVTHIGKEVFASCRSIETFTIAKDNPNYISEYNCMIVVPNASTRTLVMGNQSGIVPIGVTNIDAYAFLNQTSMTSVTIPSSVRYIASGAFSGCTALNTINYISTEAKWNQITKGSGWDSALGNYTLNVIEGGIKHSLKKERIGFVLGEKGYLVGSTDQLPADTTSVEIPSSYKGVPVVGVSGGAFGTGITDIKLPVSVVKIGEGAFEADSFYVTYAGTKEAWRTAVKDVDWTASKSYTVKCSDGTLTYEDLAEKTETEEEEEE